MIKYDQHSNCIRAIRWFVMCGQHGILQHIIDEMITQKGNINDLFQIFCNIEQQSCREINEDDTGTEVDISEDDDTTAESLITKSGIKKKKLFHFINADTDLDTLMSLDHTCDNDSEAYIKSNIDIHNEQMTVEQWRLLCLGC